MDLAFREEWTTLQRGFRIIKHLLTLLIAGILAIAATGTIIAKIPEWEVRAEARTAVLALKDGDLTSLGEILAKKRGQSDFAYFFTSKVTPRDLGDALATVAGISEEHPLKNSVDIDAYELTLVDLAGTLSLATHGIGNHALAKSWTKDYILASTTPLELYGRHKNFFDKEGKQREKQDLANKANLQLLLSRGYWSSEFLEAVTAHYHDFDIQEGHNAWPHAEPGNGARYAPAPNGVYLTDGILALTAALTANPAAAEWAFTEFLPDTVHIDDTNYSIGGFTHYLLFEHRFYELSSGESPGMTATLTALSSAIESASWASGVQESISEEAVLDDIGPTHDVAVLTALANDLPKQNNCSWHPRDYVDCITAGVKAVWQWLQKWGHTVLNILTLSTFAPPPFNTVGVAAAATNATWYAVEGDYNAAGLSLAAAVPALSFTKIAKSTKADSSAERAAVKTSENAKVATKYRTSANVVEQRVKLRDSTRAEIERRTPKNANGDFIDENTGKAIPKDRIDVGHKPGYEWRCTQKKAREEGWTRKQVIEYENDPSHYQIEDRSSNRSHRYESKTCAK